MKVSEGHLGRVFVIRLEDGDTIPGSIELFAEQRKIAVGQLVMIGGVGEGQVVVGPRRSDEMPPEPVLVPIDGAHEVVGIGLITPDEQGKPVLHVHAALGRSEKTTTGCLRPGVATWKVGEVIVCEILGVDVFRARDAQTGFELLKITSS